MAKNFVRLNFESIGAIANDAQFFVITLLDKQRKRQVNAITDKEGYRLIGMHLVGDNNSDDRLPKVLLEALKENSYLSEYFILIGGLVDGTFVTCLCNDILGSNYRIRIADAVALSLISTIPIYITRSLMQKQSTPFSEDANGVTHLPVNILTSDILEASLQQALDNENYEAAKALSDELKRRKREDGE